MAHDTDIGRHTKKSDKNNKNSKSLQLLGDILILGLTTLQGRRMRGDLIKSFKMLLDFF